MTATAAAAATFVVTAPPTTHPKVSLVIRDDDHQRPTPILVPSQIFRPNNMLKRKSSKAITNHSMLPAASTTSSGVAFAPTSPSSQGVTPLTLLPRHHTQQRSHSTQVSTATATARSQPAPLYNSLQTTTTTTTTTTTSNEITTTDGNLKRGRRRNRTQRKKQAAMAEKKAAAAAAATATGTSRVDLLPYDSFLMTAPMDDVTVRSNATSASTHFQTSGNLPDIYWRSIPMEHLRHHPNFIALPEPNTIRQLHSMDDVRKFRQESWQWDTLHHGRCTTSQAVAALGFLEHKVGEELGVPLSWRRGGTGAFVRLSVTPLRTLDEMNSILVVPHVDDGDHPTNITTAATRSHVSGMESSLWRRPKVSNMEPSDAVRIGFAAQYQYRITSEQQQDRKKYARKISQNENMSKSIRMMWGNTQEATAVLTAINYFTKLDPGFRLEEVGMCGAGLSLNVTSSTENRNNGTHHNESAAIISSSLLIGATPDGILRHSNGLIEVLEVKNHCPFFSNSFHNGKGIKNKGGVRKRFTIGSMPFDDKSNGVFAHYVPQLQLEMLCVGPECQSAVMIRQTATAGAIILRMHRDNEWIEEMLYWLHRFQLDFVESKKPPPKNFFWDAPNLNDRARYRRFANRTKEIRNSRVELVARIHNDEIQRMGDHASLFLD